MYQGIGSHIVGGWGVHHDNRHFAIPGHTSEHVRISNSCFVINLYLEYVNAAYWFIRDDRTNYVQPSTASDALSLESRDCPGKRTHSATIPMKQVGRALRDPCSEFEVTASVPAPFLRGDNLA